MKDRFIILFVTLLAFLMVGCAETPQTGPTRALVTLTMLPSATPFPPQTFTPTISPTETQTPTPTATETPVPTETPTTTPTSVPVTLIGAGDISYCGPDWIGDENTAEVLARLIEQHPNAAIFTAGDNSQGEGTRAEYRNCFDPSWGRFKDRIRPAPGNHDYVTEGAAPYYEYFGAAAGEPGKGYYSYDLGDWHIVVLNSNCNYVACRNDSQQVAWLREDLANSDKKCTLMYWHHPLFTSGPSGNYGAARSFWQAGEDFGVEIVVNGHDHQYERFAPQDHGGNATPDGIRQFIVGTGGAYHRDWGEVQPNSEVRDNRTHGVINFTLYSDRYEWEFVPVAGSTFTDSGSTECH